MHLRRRETQVSDGQFGQKAVLLPDDERSNSHYRSLAEVKILTPLSLSSDCPPSFLFQIQPPEGVTLQTAHIS